MDYSFVGKRAILWGGVLGLFPDLVFLVLMTHILSDCLTVYGTQIFWPLPTPPVMWSAIFIIDPMYSLPLIGCILAALLFRRTSLKGHTVISSLFFLTANQLPGLMRLGIHIPIG